MIVLVYLHVLQERLVLVRWRKNGYVRGADECAMMYDEIRALQGDETYHCEGYWAAVYDRRMMRCEIDARLGVLNKGLQ